MIESDVKQRSHVAIFLPSLDCGGVERVMLTLGGGFAERGIVVDLVLGNSQGPFSDKVPNGVSIFDLKAARIRAAFGPLVEYLKERAPDVLITAKEHTSLVSLWARRKARVSTRIIVTAHVMLSRQMMGWCNFKGRVIVGLIRRYYHEADKIIAVSGALANDLQKAVGIPASRIEIIYNPVVVNSGRVCNPEVHPWFNEGQPPVIVGAGRLVEEKGFDLLIEAVGLLKRRCGCRLLILGEGRERDRLEAIVLKLGLRSEVQLVGYVRDPGEYIARARVFALASKWESLPTVVIEALVVGTPVVAVDCEGGIREILPQGEYGRLVPGRSAQSLADGLLEELQRPRGKIPEEAWKKFMLESVVENYMRTLGLHSGAREDC